MSRNLAKLMHLSDHRVKLAQAKLTSAEAKVAACNQQLQDRTHELDELTATFDARRQAVLDGFIGAPSVRLEVDEVIERLRAIDDGITSARDAVKSAKKNLEKAHAAHREAMEGLKKTELDRDRRTKALAPVLAAERHNLETRREQAQEEDFLNGFGR